MLIGTRACERYLDCADWFETHPYINAREENGIRGYDREINTLGNYIDEISTLNRPDKCIGSMPTAFASRSHERISRYPNFVEMVCHTWAFMIRGCKTLFPYAFVFSTLAFFTMLMVKHGDSKPELKKNIIET